MALNRKKIDTLIPNKERELSKIPLNEIEVLEILPLVKDGNLGKYVFLYDYEKEIFSPEAEQIMEQKGDGVPYNLPKESFYNLRFSKGDVVNVVDFKKYNNDKGVLVVDKKVMLINVPKYVTPIGGLKGFKPTVEVNNYDGFLQKVVESTPLTTKLGVGFGKNPNPKMKPILDNPVIPPPTDTPVTPPPTDAPVVTNGVQNTEETKGFFEDKNNLIMVGVILLVGYLLLDNKSE